MGPVLPHWTPAAAEADGAGAPGGKSGKPVWSAPTDIALSNTTVDETAPQGTVIGQLSATDPDNGEQFTFSLQNNAGGLFSISGEQVQIAGDGLDFETAESHSILVEVTDKRGMSYQEWFIIDVRDVDETPDGTTSSNQAPTNITLVGSSVQEDALGGTAVGTVSASDPDGDSVSFSLVGGATGLFELQGTALEVAAGASFDFETTSSYSLTIRATDSGGLFSDQVVTITVGDVNEAPADIALSNTTLDENAPEGTVVGQLSATDPDNDEQFTYSLRDDAGGRFSISGDQVQVAGVGLDFEAAESHSILVEVTDKGGMSYQEWVTIAVRDVDETADTTSSNQAPTNITLVGSSVQEDALGGTAVGTVSASDPDGDSISFSLVGGATGLFELQGTALEVAGGASFDFETTSSYSLTIRATDSGGLSSDQMVTISVSDVNEAPTNLSLENNTVPENSIAGTPVGQFTADDPDIDETLTYQLMDDAGGRFYVEGAWLKVADGANLDYESQSQYSVIARVTDSAGNVAEQTLPVYVTDVLEGEAPADPAYYVEALLLGNSYRWNAGDSYGTPVTVTYGFPDSLPSYYSSTSEYANNFEPFREQQKSAVHDILAKISEVTTVTFDYVENFTSDVLLSFANASFNTSYGAYAYYPSLTSDRGGDVWVNNHYTYNYSPSEGNYAYLTLVHEIGHAVGLGHSTALPSGEDNRDHTVMSYKSGGSPEPDAMMLYDIAALQYIYGTNTLSNSGNTAYPASDVQAIWDTGGNDTLTGSSGSDLIDLREGAFSGRTAIAYGTVIENAAAGDGNDTVIGNSADNSLSGGSGSDVFHFASGWGDDIITDFADGQDRMDLSATGLQLGNLAWQADPAGSGTIISDGAGNTISLPGVDASLIGSEDFLF